MRHVIVYAAHRLYYRRQITDVHNSGRHSSAGSRRMSRQYRYWLPVDSASTEEVPIVSLASGWRTLNRPYGFRLTALPVESTSTKRLAIVPRAWTPCARKYDPLDNPRSREARRYMPQAPDVVRKGDDIVSFLTRFKDTAV